MTVYNAQLGTGESQTISAGSHILTFEFRWDNANEEQWEMVKRALDNRRDSDPLIVVATGDIVRDYDWFEYYEGLGKHIDIEELEKIPQSVRKLATEELQIWELEERRDEAVALKQMCEVYEEQRVWNVKITDESGVEKSGAVRPGGWIGNQDSDWRVRFVTLLDSVGKEDLGKVYVEAEVRD